MNDQRRHPDDQEVEHSGERQPAESGGALTGATGSLTSSGFGTEPFVPGELREIADPNRAGRMTAELHAHAQQAQTDSAGMEEGPRAGGPTEMAQHSGGYGSTSGLSADDPAYRVDAEPATQPAASKPASGDSDAYDEGEERY